MRAPALCEGSASLSSENGQSDPCPPVHEGLSSAHNTQYWCAHSAYETRNIFVRSGTSGAQSLAAVIGAWDVPNLHEDASGVCGESRVDCLKLWPFVLGAGISVTTIEILIPKDSSLLRDVGVVSVDHHGTNEFCGLPQSLDQCGLLLLG